MTHFDLFRVHHRLTGHTLGMYESDDTVIVLLYKPTGAGFSYIIRSKISEQWARSEAVPTEDEATHWTADIPDLRLTFSRK